MSEKKDEMISVMADALANTKARHPNCRGPFKIEFPEDTRATTPTASELVKALRPFAEYATKDGFGLDNHEQPVPDSEGVGWVYLTVGDFRRARAALSTQQTLSGETDG